MIRMLIIDKKDSREVSAKLISNKNINIWIYYEHFEIC